MQDFGLEQDDEQADPDVRAHRQEQACGTEPLDSRIAHPFHGEDGEPQAEGQPDRGGLVEDTQPPSVSAIVGGIAASRIPSSRTASDQTRAPFSRRSSEMLSERAWV